jgi:hypothetical protein
MKVRDSAYTRPLLKVIMEDVREHVKPEDIKAAWPFKVGKGHFEFHGSQKFYWHGSAADLWEARANGWAAYLRKLNIPGYRYREESYPAAALSPAPVEVSK